MKRLALGFLVLPFLAGVVLGAQPKTLSDAQIDKVSAGTAANPLPAPALIPDSMIDDLSQADFDPTDDEEDETDVA
jgi:hypothetical protein